LPKEKKSILTVKTLYRENRDSLKLVFSAGRAGLNHEILSKDIHRPGLALAGFVDLFTYQRVQICGNTEMLYLQKLSSSHRAGTLKRVFDFKIPCMIVTSDNEIPCEMIEAAEKKGTPLFRTPFATTKVTQILGDYLDEKFAPRAYIHGSLVDVYGIGILITGRSGIGKSEVALDLVARGHRLVADDVVTVMRHTGGIIIGRGNNTLRYNMEIRGVGVIDISSIFGIRGIRRQKRVEVQVELTDWDNSGKYERLGLDDLTIDMLGESVPLVRLPIYPGKNISVIVETIALNQLLKLFGVYSARHLTERLTKTMNKKLKALEDYLDHDFE